MSNLTFSLEADGIRIRNLADGTEKSDAVTMGQLDAGLAAKVDAADKGAAGGVATLDASGKVAAQQLPAPVDFSGNMQGGRLVNLGEGVDPSDAVNVRQLEAVYVALERKIADVAGGVSPALQPDLVVTKLSVSPEAPEARNELTFAGTITNRGAGSTPDGVVHRLAFLVDGALVAWSDTHTASLAPGESVTLIANSGQTDSGAWIAIEGTHTVRAHLDDVEYIAESDATNNVLEQALVVSKVAESGIPDLEVSAISWSPESPKQGDVVTFSATIKNQGTGPTPDGVVVGVAFKVDGTLVSWSDTHATALAPGATVTLTANGGPGGGATWTTTAGSHTIEAWVDDINRIPGESDKTNNKLTQVVQVAAIGGLVADLGQNPGNGAFTEESCLNACTTNFRILNSGIVRNGIDGVAGRTNGAAFTWTTRDYVVAKYIAGGYTNHAVIDPLYHVVSTSNWFANWTYFCYNVMNRYKDKIRYYIIGNELDNQGVSVANMIACMKIAYEQSRIVAPDGSIKIESCPAAHFEGTWQRDLILGGVTRYCDVVGMHIYGGGIHDGRGIGTVPAYILQANSANGYPIKPAANSENGCSSAWAPAGLDARDWQGRCARLNWVQAKRYGMSNIILYSFGRSTAGEGFNFGNWAGNVYKPYPIYNDIRYGCVRKGLTNAGFESANDKYRGDWIIHWNVDSSNPPEAGRVSFVTNDGTNARTGTGYCKMTSGGANRVRQVVSLLTPGQQYTIHAPMPRDPAILRISKRRASMC